MIEEKSDEMGEELRALLSARSGVVQRGTIEENHLNPTNGDDDDDDEG